MGKGSKAGRGGQAVVKTLPDGRQISIQDTPAGTRAHLHDGGVTVAVDPAAYGVAGTSRSTVGGGHARIPTTTPEGAAIAYTRREDCSTRTVIHHDGESKTKR